MKTSSILEISLITINRNKLVCYCGYCIKTITVWEKLCQVYSYTELIVIVSKK